MSTIKSFSFYTCFCMGFFNHRIDCSFYICNFLELCVLNKKNRVLNLIYSSLKIEGLVFFYWSYLKCLAYLKNLLVSFCITVYQGLHTVMHLSIEYRILYKNTGFNVDIFQSIQPEISHIYRLLNRSSYLKVRLKTNRQNRLIAFGKAKVGVLQQSFF